MSTCASASLMRSRSDAAVNPPNTTEWAAPIRAHASIAAAASGIHVLCEKPIAHTPASADKIVQACRDAGVLLGMDFNQRLTPGYVKAREMIAHGVIGRIYRVNFIASGWYRTQTYYNSGGWRGTWAGACADVSGATIVAWS